MDVSADGEEVAFCVLFPCPQGILRRLVMYPNTSLTVCWVTVGGHVSELVHHEVDRKWHVGQRGRLNISS